MLIYICAISRASGCWKPDYSWQGKEDTHRVEEGRDVLALMEHTNYGNTQEPSGFITHSAVGGLCRRALSGCRHLEKEAATASLCTHCQRSHWVRGRLCQFRAGPIWGRLCYSHGSEASVLDMAVPVSNNMQSLCNASTLHTFTRGFCSSSHVHISTNNINKKHTKTNVKTHEQCIIKLGKGGLRLGQTWRVKSDVRKTSTFL